MLSFVSENTAVAEGPSVAIVIPNWNGVQHLPDCLDSVDSLEYPRDRYEVILVDNGSTDSSLELVEREYPWVRIVKRSENLGFAAASNAGASAATAECVAFLNNDMRVDSNWLTELVAAYDPQEGYVCVAGTILSWDGTRIDFVDGLINFFGDVLLDGQLSAAMRQTLRQYITGTTVSGGLLPAAASGGKPNQSAATLPAGPLRPAFVDQKVRGLVYLMMAAPEYQLA